MMDNAEATPEEIAQEKAQAAMDHVARYASTIPEQYALAVTLLKWEGQAAEALQVRFERWLLDTIGTAPVKQGHAADELTPTTDGEATA